MSDILRVANLTVGLGNKRTRATASEAPRSLLQDISFTVANGERVGLIGESGSGKSLTALAITRLLPDSMISSGDIFLADRLISDSPDREMQKIRGKEIAVVFQEPATALDPLMRVGQQIAEPLRRHFGLQGSALRDSVLTALAEVQLGHSQRIMRAYPHEISGGERQRVAIAAALACKPKLLIADEPTTALDVTIQGEVLRLIESLISERAMSLIFITHDLAVVSQVADRVLVMTQGAIVEDLSTNQLINAPTHPYTKKLLRNARLLDSALEG